jgi:hypothetical protein
MSKGGYSKLLRQLQESLAANRQLRRQLQERDLRISRSDSASELQQADGGVQQPQQSLPQERRSIHLDRKEAILLAVALAPTLAGLVIEDLLSLYILLGISLIALLWVCAIHEGAPRHRVIAAILIAASYCGVAFRKYEVTVQAAQRDARDHLAIEMQGYKLDKNSSPIFVYGIKNDGMSGITSHRTTCIFNKIIDDKNSAVVIAPHGISNPWNSDLIEAGGDAQTEVCGAKFIALNGPLVCIDLTIKVEYTLSVQPTVIDSKSVRFVNAKWMREHWVQQSPNTAGNFCDGSADIY